METYCWISSFAIPPQGQTYQERCWTAAHQQGAVVFPQICDRAHVHVPAPACPFHKETHAPDIRGPGAPRGVVFMPFTSPVPQTMRSRAAFCCGYFWLQVSGEGIPVREGDEEAPLLDQLEPKMPSCIFGVMRFQLRLRQASLPASANGPSNVHAGGESWI